MFAFLPFFFVKNPYFNGENDLILKLEQYSKVSTNIWISPEFTFLRIKSGTEISVPCKECPGLFEIKKMGLPTL